MKDNLRPKLANRAAEATHESHTQALAAIRARTAVEVMKERRDLERHLYDVMGPGDEYAESRSLLRLPWQRTTH